MPTAPLRSGDAQALPDPTVPGALDDVERPGKSHFAFSEYVTKQRWISYWHQLDEALQDSPATCLMVGVGDGVVADALRQAGVEVTTADIIEELRSDIVADVRDLPMPGKTFDVVICCQVLEHIPYATVSEALSELVRVARQRVIISVPNSSRAVFFRLGLGQRQLITRRASVGKRQEWTCNGVHHWELGWRNYRVRPWLRLLRRHGKLLREYRVADFPYHHFFILGPR